MTKSILDQLREAGVQEIPATWVPGKHEDLELYEGKPMRFIDDEGNEFWIPLYTWFDNTPAPPPAPKPAPRPEYVPPRVNLRERIWMEVKPVLGFVLGMAACLVGVAIAVFALGVLGGLIGRLRGF